MKPIRHSISVVRWGLFMALAIVAAPRTAQAQYFDFGFDYGTGYGTAVTPTEIYGNVPNYDYVTPNDVYGFGGIDFYGTGAAGNGGGYQGMGYDSGSGYGYSAFGSTGPGFGVPFANPVLVEGQNAEGDQGRATQRKAARKAPARTKKPAGAAADRKNP
jgi:hypothetical protein